MTEILHLTTRLGFGAAGALLALALYAESHRAPDQP
jgi:hypothetical protein